MRTTHRSGVSGAFLWLLIMSLLPFSFHCIKTPLEPKAPSWKTQLTVPLLDRTYYFADIVNKDPKFDTTGTNILYKPTANDIGFQQGIPASVFQMPSPRGNTIDQEMGAVPVSLGIPPSVSVTASQLGLSSGTVPPLTPDPPAISVNQSLGDSASYKWLIYDSGQMTLSVKNNFQFSIQFVGNSVQLVNLDDTTQVVGTFTFAGPIASGATAQSGTVQLAGVRMYAGLKLKASIQILSWAGKSIASGDNITATLGLTNGLISSALVNTLNFSETDVVAVPDSAVQLDDSIKVKIAKFQSGGMRVRIINNAALKLTVEFKIAELIDQATSQPYRLPGTDPNTGYVTIDPKDSLVTIINMNTQNFISRERSGSDTVVTQYLHFSLGMKTLSAGTNQFSIVNKTDNVIADVQPVQSFVLQEVQGKVPPQSIDINQNVDAGIGDIGNNLTLDAFSSNIQLSARILSTGLFPTNLVVRIWALDKTGNRSAQSVLIRNANEIANNTQYHRIVPGVVDIVPIQSSDINLLMNSFLATKKELPSKFLLEGYALVSPLDVYTNPSSQFGVGIGGVKQDDSIFVSLDYAIPIAIGIQNGSLKDTSSFSENNIDTSQVSSIESGKIYLNIENTFPVTMDVQLKLLKAQTNDESKVDTASPPVLTLPQNFNDPVNYPPIKVAADSTVNRTGVKSFTFVNLTPSDAGKLADASFAALNLKMLTPGNGLVAQQFKKTDKIRIKTFANIVFVVDFDRLGN